MTAKPLRRARYAPTGELRKRSTRPLGDTGLLRDHQTPEQLLGQVDKLLTESELLSSRFAAISDLSVAINASLRPEDIYDVIVAKARYALGFDYCSVGILNDGGGAYMLRPLAWPAGTIESPGIQIFDASDGLPASVREGGTPLTVQDITERPLKVRPARYVGLLHPELEGILAAAGLRSVMILPLHASGQTLGCIIFSKFEADCYNQDDLQLGYLFSVLLATALHNSRLFDAETRRAHQLQVLNEIGQTATSILNPAALIASVPPLVQIHFGYDVAKIGLIERDEVVYSSTAQCISGCPSPVDERFVISRNDEPVGVVGLAASNSQIVLVPNVFEDDRWSNVPGSLSGPHIRSILVIPMIARDRVLGVLHFESELIDAFKAADVSILQTLANQLGVALDNARLYQQLNELFHGYIAPQVASTLLDDPTNARLGGQRRDVTVLFADLNNFTSLSEQIPAEELLDLLNVCLGIATDAILKYGGTLDKYMGDAVMALFNAPAEQADHAWRATRAAIAMQMKLRQVTAKWKHRLIFSIGINSGEAVVGNIGSSSLRNYTAIGDTVNLAKRVQETATPGQILVSQATYELALTSAATEQDNTEDNTLVAYHVGTESIKGRSQSAVIYEINPYFPPLLTHPVPSESLANARSISSENLEPVEESPDLSGAHSYRAFADDPEIEIPEIFVSPDPASHKLQPVLGHTWSGHSNNEEPT